MDIGLVFVKDETKEAEAASFIPFTPVHIKTERVVR